MTADLAEKVKELMTEYKDIEVKYKTELLRDKVRLLRLRCLSDDGADDPGCERGSREILQGARQVRPLLQEELADGSCSAIMKFHSHKMEEINSTLKELWQKTYQGTGELPPLSFRC